MQPCARGCLIHLAECPSYGRKGGDCRGCAPRMCSGDSLICSRCYGRTRAMLEAVPDMAAHLRALTNPLKGTQYDRDSGGGGGKLHAPPPVPVELLDAADFIVTLLWSTTVVMRGEMPEGRMQVPVAADAVDLYVFTRDARDEILRGLSSLSRRPEIVPFADAVIGLPETRDEWTLRTIFERWSLVEAPWWAAQPCPACDKKAIKVTPAPTPAAQTRYRCEACEWVAPDDVDGLWAAGFSRRAARASSGR